MNQVETIPVTLSEPSRRRKAAQVVRKAGHFIKGPIPMIWIEQAARLPGKAFAVGMMLWFLRGMAGDKPVKISASLRQRFGVGRKAVGRALTALERAGLIKADRSRGRLHRVWILPAKGVNHGEETCIG